MLELLGSSSRLEIEGETGFLGEDGGMYVSPSADCSPGQDSLLGDDDERVFAPLADFDGDGRHVCIEVDGETPIPETEPYRVRIVHDSTTAAFPVSETEHALGRIGRDGATVRIPYLTTNERYNQRIVAVNRSGRPADYTLTFVPSEGTAATPEDAASGTLPAGRTVLNVRDVVTLDDGARQGDHSAAVSALTTRTARCAVGVG